MDSRTQAEKPTPLLVVEDLHTRLLSSRGWVQAVDGVSFTMRAGETLGIVGESGSGKSVLGRTIMGLYTNGPNIQILGSVRFGDTDIHAISDTARRDLWGAEIGMVFQDPMTALNPVKKVGAHLTESLRKHRGLSRSEARSRAEELLGLVGIPEPRRRLDQYPHELSGGMRQRVVIAMALANEPKLLIADEPTTALDVTVQRQILDLLGRLRDELDMAMILVSHNLGVVAGRSDKVAVMYAGRVVETADTRTLFAQPHHPYTEALMAAIPRLASAPHSSLAAIEGTPPDMVSPPFGCRFAPRCPRAQKDCVEIPPALLPAIDHGLSVAGHAFACHHPVNAGGS